MTDQVEAVRRRAVSGFTLYDVANSAFVTTVITAIGPPFITSVAEAAQDAGGRVDLLGLTPRADAVYAYAISLSVVLQVLTLPVLGAPSDRARAKRAVLVGGTVVGAGATVLLSLVPTGAPLAAVAALVVVNVAFGVAITAYNAHLADVAELADRDAVSARGFAHGYAGGALVLAVALVLVSAAGALGISTGTAGRLSIALSGLWWLVVGLVAVRRLDAARQLPWAQPDPGGRVVDGVRDALAALRGSFAALRALPGTARFLLAFLLFNDAIQAVIALSSVFLTQELYVARGLPAADATSFLLTLVLLIQVVAVGGAAGSARLAARYGARRVLLATLVLWVGVVLFAVLALDSTRGGVRAGRGHRPRARRQPGARALAVQRDGRGRPAGVVLLVLRAGGARHGLDRDAGLRGGAGRDRVLPRGAAQPAGAVRVGGPAAVAHRHGRGHARRPARLSATPRRPGGRAPAGRGRPSAACGRRSRSRRRSRW